MKRLPENGFPWAKMSALLAAFATFILGVMCAGFWLFMDNHNDQRYLRLGTHEDFSKSETEHFATIQQQQSKMWEAINKTQENNNQTGQQLLLVNEKLSVLSTQVGETRSDIKMLLIRRSGSREASTIP